MFLKLVILGLNGHQWFNHIRIVNSYCVFSLCTLCYLASPSAVFKSVLKCKQIHLCSCKITICLSFSGSLSVKVCFNISILCFGSIPSLKCHGTVRYVWHCLIPQQCETLDTVLWPWLCGHLLWYHSCSHVAWRHRWNKIVSFACFAAEPLLAIVWMVGTVIWVLSSTLEWSLGSVGWLLLARVISVIFRVFWVITRTFWVNARVFWTVVRPCEWLLWSSVAFFGSFGWLLLASIYLGFSWVIWVTGVISRIFWVATGFLRVISGWSLGLFAWVLGSSGYRPKWSPTPSLYDVVSSRDGKIPRFARCIGIKG